MGKEAIQIEIHVLYNFRFMSNRYVSKKIQVSSKMNTPYQDLNWRPLGPVMEITPLPWSSSNLCNVF